LDAIDEYLKGLLKQVLDSYVILAELDDNTSDLEIIKKELSKIKGILQVINAKLDNKKYQSDRLVSIYKLATYYIETYDFTWEIETLSKVYYNDSSRLKNLRIIILNSLNDKKLIEKFQTILSEL
jgi:hypothetical protein|tara:strand:- start:267 stop:641 length:375 start_codon:yes stop_codon:yes gene_type:complete